MTRTALTRTFRYVPKEVVTATEIATMLGVVRQRVDQLAREDPTFPKPWRTLPRMRLWDKKAILKWAAKTGRDVTPLK
jgi:prophage regulatory protein